MRAEPSRWPPIDRLLDQLSAELAVGVLERKRLDHVLDAAEVPVSKAQFVGWVDEGQGRLVDLIAAVVGVAPGDRETIARGVEAWWAVERPRMATPGRDGGLPAGSWNADGVTRDPDEDRSRRWDWSWLVLALAVLVVAALVWECMSCGDETPFTETEDGSSG
ncbi:MAG: hypothetical protein K0V04_18800, partial [Deltaproteobacteria bacterium]|nr:hypothetical protein [Deltaproteobacteria bacterium]